MTAMQSVFGTLYHPVKAFVVYEHQEDAGSVYVESYDMDSRGYPINAHPLSNRESTALAKALDSTEELIRSFLKPSGLLPKNVLYINSGEKGFAMWHTPAKKADLLFKETLTIPSGSASVPALLWVASKDALKIYALKNDIIPNENTSLYHAPFFNVYDDGRVCMGSVPIDIPKDCMLEEFMRLWEGYFFNSYFSHLFDGHMPVKESIVPLWQSLVGSRRKFPVKTLIKNNLTIKNLIQ